MEGKTIAVGKGEGRRGGKRVGARKREEEREREERGTSLRECERKKQYGNYYRDESTEEISEANYEAFSHQWCAGAHVGAETGYQTFD